VALPGDPLTTVPGGVVSRNLLREDCRVVSAYYSVGFRLGGTNRRADSYGTILGPKSSEHQNCELVNW
jgi:hypothetical protein